MVPYLVAQKNDGWLVQADVLLTTFRLFANDQLSQLTELTFLGLAMLGSNLDLQRNDW